MLGKVGSLEKSDAILKEAIDKIRNKEVETNRITKTVLVIDEAQDMDEDEFNLIKSLMEQNEDMRVIAVGDDDQNIYEFRGSSSKYLEKFIEIKAASKHELIENYRSKSNLVDFTNQFVQSIRHRLKKTPIVATQSGSGKIKLIHYQSENLVTPLVNQIIEAELAGTTCVLTKTNEEAMQITGLLLMHGVRAKLIQTNDGFSLYNLSEVRFFLSCLNAGEGARIISDDVWEDAKKETMKKFYTSSKLEVLSNILKDFESTTPKNKYKSDLEVFIRESKLEDFFNENGETIFVSTIHKAKGKEFDNVFLMLDNINPKTDESKRTLYVGMTRAKQNLQIHLNENFLDGIRTENLERIEDREIYFPPNQLVMQLSFKDIWLDYFNDKQHLISGLTSGDTLNLDGKKCLNSEGKSVLKFSKQFSSKIDSIKKSGYELKKAKVNFILYWTKEKSDQEIKIILPELYFERQCE
jgi:ATP-dependent DNA helicase RecQ